MRQLSAILAILIFSVAFTACSPKVGSEEWCEAMQEKPRGDWTANELSDFAKYCVFK